MDRVSSSGENKFSALKFLLTKLEEIFFGFIDTVKPATKNLHFSRLA